MQDNMGTKIKRSDEPDYTKYSLEDLYDVQSYIDREKHPERAKRVDDEICMREKSTEYVEYQDNFKYHTFGPRFFALCIDLMIIFPMSALLMFLWIAVFGRIDPLVNCVIFVLLSIPYSAYSVFMHGQYGQTLGKMAMKVKVYTMDEKNIDFKIAFKREILVLCSIVLALFVEIPFILKGDKPFTTHNNFMISVIRHSIALVNIIIFFSNDKRRALHDYIAGTVVVKKDMVEDNQTIKSIPI